MDTQPRHFNAENLASLGRLARQILPLLRLRKERLAFAASQELIRAQHERQTQMQVALSNSKAYFELLSNTVPAMIFYLDAEQRYQTYNRTFMEWFGVDETEVIGKTVSEFIGPIAYSKVEPHLSVAYAGQQESYEMKAPSRMGKEKWLSIVYTPNISADGAVLGVIVLSTDITRSKLTENALRESESRFRALIQEAPVATSLFLGRNLTIDIANDTMLGYWGKDRSVIGLPLADAVPELNGQPFLDILDKVFLTGEPFSTENAPAQLKVDGVLGNYYFDYTYKPLRDTNGDVFAVMDMAVDVTEQVLTRRKIEESEDRYRNLSVKLEEQVQERTQQLAAANERLSAYNEELESYNQEYVDVNRTLETTNAMLARSNEDLQRFAYIASHDLQEPLRKIQQFSDILKTRYAASNAGELQFLDRIQMSANRMSMLIRDLLDYSRVTIGHHVHRTVDLNELVSSVMTTLELVIEENNAIIHIGHLPSITGDPSQLSQLFQNLLSNALKFRRPTVAPVIGIEAKLATGSEIPASLQIQQTPLQYHRIDVYDNGVGFDEKYLDRIFQVFQRLYGRNEYAGTGIGLAICEKVVANHGGAITASSAPGAGATFSVFLPV